MSQSHSRKETAADRARCERCAWRMRPGGTDDKWACGYSLDDNNHSRVYLHYQRTGKESLDGFTFGADCTEYKSKAQADREKREKIKADIARRKKMVPLDKAKWAEVTAAHRQKEIAERCGINPKSVWAIRTQTRVRRDVVEAVKREFGIDVEAKT